MAEELFKQFWAVIDSILRAIYSQTPADRETVPPCFHAAQVACMP
jgi:hypothetical protein